MQIKVWASEEDREALRALILAVNMASVGGPDLQTPEARAALDKLEDALRAALPEANKYEECVKCGVRIPIDEADVVASLLMTETDYTLDEGPFCALCAQKRRRE